MHAIGPIAANISFAAVAISLTHTVKTLEPAFNVVLSRLILGEATPLPAVLSLIPIMLDRRGIDPAIASSIFLTTVTDCLGFFSFLGLATLILL